jgi:hypothetical protein
MFFGAPNAKVSGIENSGRVLQYVRENRTWNAASPPAFTFFPPVLRMIHLEEALVLR